MKNKLSLLVAFIMGIAFIFFISWKNNDDKKVQMPAKSQVNPSPDSRPIIALRKIRLKAGVTQEAFEKFAAKAADGGYCKIPGVRIYFGKGERGDEPGTYIYFLEFDSKATRDYYVPEEDDNSKATADARKLVEPFINNFLVEFDKVADYKITGKKGFTDYIILE